MASHGKSRKSCHRDEHRVACEPMRHANLKRLELPSGDRQRHALPPSAKGRRFVVLQNAGPPRLARRPRCAPRSVERLPPGSPRATKRDQRSVVHPLRVPQNAMTYDQPNVGRQQRGLPSPAPRTRPQLRNVARRRLARPKSGRQRRARLSVRLGRQPNATNQLGADQAPWRRLKIAILKSHSCGASVPRSRADSRGPSTRIEKKGRTPRFKGVRIDAP